MREKKYKRCPRCDKRTPIYQDRCDSCGLVFSRLSKASNTAAKKAIKAKEYNKVICNKDLPYDISKWKLFFIALFFGWAGAHYAKIGKYKTFVFMIVSVIFVYIASFLMPLNLFEHKYLFLLMWALILPGSISVMLWLVSVFQILFNRFKVPISIDEELVTADLDEKVVTEILNDIKKNEVTEQNIKNIKENNEKNLGFKRIKVVCASCGESVKVRENETICPKCDEPLNGD